MKIKIKDEMEDIRLKISYNELQLIIEGLKQLENSNYDLMDYNLSVFDCQEYNNTKEVKNKIKKIYRKLLDKTSDIYPY